jgi:NADPH-dependent 2,4-dienoyl-CoA reductase/sulfur reductase-like enzyme
MDILVFERGLHTSYSACGMPYFVEGIIEKAESLIVRSPQVFREKYNIDVRVRHEVQQIDIRGRRVRILNRNTQEQWWEGYDHLLIATGAVPFCPNVPGSEVKGIYGLSALQSGIRVRRAVDEDGPRRAVIVGGGYIGLEMAEALVTRGLDVALVELAPQVMGTLDPDMGTLVSDALRKIGVKLYLNEALESFGFKDGHVQEVITDHRTLPADLVILGMGVRPNSALAKEAGIPLGVKGAIRVNSRMQTEVAGIWAAGDCAETFHLVKRQPFHVALGTVANKQGRVAGINLGGGYATFPGVVGTAISKICKLEIARTGLQEKEIRGLGLEYVTATINTRTRAGYYPGNGRITVKMLAEKGSGRLLGGQIVGTEGSAKRIDTLATALHGRFTVQEIIDLDLSYAPPFSPVWDPVQTAARQVAKLL